MKTVIVTYQVRPEYAKTNATNILAAMEELRSLDDPGIRYQALTQQDGVTFVHIGQYADEAAQKRATEVPAFVRFQTQLKESGLVEAPRAEWLSPVGAMFDVFPG